MSKRKRPASHGATRKELYSAVAFLATGLMYCLQAMP